MNDGDKDWPSQVEEGSTCKFSLVFTSGTTLSIIATIRVPTATFSCVLNICIAIYCVNFPVSSLTKSSNDPRELYLGLLYPTEDYKVYPF